ncbi:hypothetical protein SAMN04487949_1112 [Halogranum gelatinilyticum]|uniref:DUF1684 domain-containing protein n=1 Tax=Halogranum gelatinilyticum TaxID=660521 RepID=A0A1G9R2F3_9EURY|nr:DUF1684 domain-containing protein [Halogranum gelatinilyticum]SDM16625.1 hypothetical protein SAMN04487949_1112 [Halogranum gelatinilyticum]
MSVSDGWQAALDALEEHRADKDEFFGEHPQSPIPHDQREIFEGLSYFDPDPAYRFELELHEHETKETVTVATTTEGERDYVAWGEFRFTVDGEEQTLQAYSRDGGGDEFWLPFRDETSGEETYGAGRYLELDAEDRTDEGTWILDFNYAYSPFCAYNEAYECPLVPMANWLEVEIRAGEKTYTPGGE